MALIVASVTLGVSLLFLTGLLRNLPKAVLAAIVFVAVTGLIDLREIARLRRVSRLEFRVAMIALVGVLLLGVLKGVLLAVVASLTLAVALVFLTGLVRDLPKAVLAAIGFVAVTGLIEVRAIARVRRVSRLEFRVAMIALVGVLLLGVLRGVLLAVLASILLLLHRAAFPHVAVLGRIPQTDRFSDLERNPDNERLPGVFAFRVESSLLYFNVDHVRREVLRHVDAQPGTRLVVCDLSTSPYVDIAGARMLAKLGSELGARGATLRLAETRSTVRDVLRAEGLDATAGPISRRTSVANTIAAFEGMDGTRTQA
jgi:MFS superfamily sulfate permease-like transporter